MYSQPSRQVHLDFHTSPDIANVGRDFDPQVFATTLKRAAIESVTCFARCHHGHLYYQSEKFPERIHPHLMRPNLLGDQIEACHKVRIRVPIYVTVQWDQFSAEHHPEWLCIDANGTQYGTKPFTPGFYRNLDVLHSGYRAFLLEHVKEILETFDVDGIFFDIVQPKPSTAMHWRTSMAFAGNDFGDENARNRHALKVIRDWESEMSEFIRRLRPSASVFYNSGHIGPRSRLNQHAYTHFELESLPSGGWGYLHFPQAMRYARTLGKPCLGMTGKFHTTWGDFGSYKNEAALAFECNHMIALGAQCSIGDQLPPTGLLDPPTYDAIGAVYRRIATKSPWCLNAVPLVEAAVLTPEALVEVDGYHADIERNQPSVLGAVRLLQELKIQFDIVDLSSDWSQYRLLVIPDDFEGNFNLSSALNAYVTAGGSIIASAKAALDSSNGTFPACYGLISQGDAMYAPDYIIPEESFGVPLPLSPHVMYLRGQSVGVSADVKILARRCNPYFNRTWETFCSHNHAPPTALAVEPGITQNGNVVYFAHPIFAQYRANAPLWVKKLLSRAIDRLLPVKLVTTSAPSPAIITLNRQESLCRDTLHIMCYIPERRGQDFDTIEDVIPIHNTAVSIHVDKSICSVYLQPENIKLDTTSHDRGISFVIPCIDGHQMVELSWRD